MYTRYGHVPYLSEDILIEHLGQRMSYQRLLCLSTVLNMSPQISKCGGSRKFLGIDQESIVFVSQVDPTEQRLMGADTNSCAAFQVRGGRRTLEPSAYVEVVNSLSADFSPFMIATPNSLSSSSALRKCVKRSASHANMCYKLGNNEFIVSPVQSDLKSEPQPPDIACALGKELMSEQNAPGDSFMGNRAAPVSPDQGFPTLGDESSRGKMVGNKKEDTRKSRTSKEHSPSSLIMGPSIDCSFSTEHISMQINELGREILSCSPVIYFYSNPDLLPVSQFANIVQQLPPNSLKVLFGASRPDCLMTALSAGFDVFDNAFCYTLTEKKLALVFDFENLAFLEHTDCADINSAVLDCSHLHYRDDFSPLLKKCHCYTCQTYTKAYLNHLIVTKELLAPILLNIHNLFWYDKFFSKVCHFMQQGDFVSFDNLRSKLQRCKFTF